MTISPEELQRLRQANPRGTFDYELSDGSAWVFRRPTADEWRACKGELGIAIVQEDAARMSRAHEQLAHSCCVHPGPDAFQALRDEDPAIAGQFGERLFAAFGSGRSIVEGKAGSSPAKP
ncbi:MAG: hypothetical protein U0324_29160 [Polyangiales bacterium]